MGPRQLEDRICVLCQKLIDSNDDAEFEAIAAELRKALAEHIERLRHTLGLFPVSRESHFSTK